MSEITVTIFQNPANIDTLIPYLFYSLENKLLSRVKQVKLYNCIFRKKENQH